MQLHPRHMPTQRAKLAIMDTVGKEAQAHDLTFPELWMILCEIGASWAKGAIRQDREEIAQIGSGNQPTSAERAQTTPQERSAEEQLSQTQVNKSLSDDQG